MADPLGSTAAPAEAELAALSDIALEAILDDHLAAATHSGPQPLEDVFAAATQSGGAILDEGAATQGGRAILDEGAGTEAQTQPNGAQPEPEEEDDDMSEPTEAEVSARQAQLDAASSEFDAATPTGITDESGEQLFSDGPFRPHQPSQLAAPATPSP